MLQAEFLARFFGQNKEVQDLAEACLRKGRRDAALEINRAVKVLGPSLNFDSLMFRIVKKFPDIFEDRKKEQEYAQSDKQQEEKIDNRNNNAWIIFGIIALIVVFFVGR